VLVDLGTEEARSLLRERIQAVDDRFDDLMRLAAEITLLTPEETAEIFRLIHE
jgi:hypothetical protein